jgi:hypothetical protein
MARSNKKRALFGLLFGLVVGLLAAEAIVRITDVDWRFVRKHLYYQGSYLEVQEPDLDPERLYRLKPGAVHQYDHHSVRINELGFRGPERSVEKPNGVFRILCFGGSNVFGQDLEYEDSWPAQLEQELNRGNDGRYEVWNMGVSAYVGVQMARLAREAIEKYEPDLIIMGLSNQWSIPFLLGGTIEPVFVRRPAYWFWLIPEPVQKRLDMISRNTQLTLLSRWRSFRLVVLAISSKMLEPGKTLAEHNRDFWEVKNSQSVRELLVETNDIVPAVVFLGPFTVCRYCDWDNIDPAKPGPKFLSECYGSYFHQTGTPVLNLCGEGMPEEYLEIHPPPQVTKWYASRIASWLWDRNLVATPSE